jgi:hypothetical protein
VAYDHDLVTGRGKIRKRNKGASRQFRSAYGYPRCRPPRPRGPAAFKTRDRFSPNETLSVSKTAFRDEGARQAMIRSAMMTILYPEAKVS